MLKLQQIIRANIGELARNITLEQGKTLIDAEGDVLRGLRELIANNLFIQVCAHFSKIQRLSSICAV